MVHMYRNSQAGRLHGAVRCYDRIERAGHGVFPGSSGLAVALRVTIQFAGRAESGRGDSE